ncbi:MAG: TonB-dependent receptor [Sphingomonadales bacterium]|nr:TonB-dependent receptor [Sphingomonadales bacterium]
MFPEFAELRRHLLHTAALPISLIAAPALAQETVAEPSVTDTATAPGEGDADATSLARNEILVVATRIKGQLDAPQAPVATLDEADIAAYGARSIPELLAALSPETGSGRGRGGGGMPIMLLNGQRISGFREMRNIPPEAIRRMEILPEEVALRFGYPPNQRVVNLILKDNFASRSLAGEYNVPTRGGFAMSELEATLFKASGANRLNLSAQINDSTPLFEAERGVIQQAGTLPTVDGDPDPARYRSLLADSRDISLNGTWSHGLGEKGMGGQLSLNAAYTRNDSSTFSGLDLVSLTAPGGATALRSLSDPLERRSSTDTGQAGLSFNKPLGRWQLTATLDGSHAETTTWIDRRADTSALVAAAAAGSLAIDGALPAQAAAGRDISRVKNDAVTSLVTLSGSPARMPAGEIMATVKGGFAWTGIASNDTRSAVGSTSLRRGDASVGVNLALPLASRRENVLGTLGELSANFSAGLDRLSDFGTITDWSAGLTWSPAEALGLSASYIVNQAAPSLGDLGNPAITSFNVPVFDFSRGETALVSVTSGGNRSLLRETQRDLKLGLNWSLPFLKNSSFIAEWFRNRSDNVTSAFPVLTPDIESAFPGRVTRDANGQLVALDRRAVTFARTAATRLRYGFNLSGTIGKAAPGGGGMMGGMGRRMGGFGGPPPGGGGGGGPRMGGPGGPPPGAMFGRGGQGRWNLAVYHTVRFSERVRVAAGGPMLDLLNGDATSGGGVARHMIELEGGAFHKGLGLRLNGSWSAPTHVRSSGSDLRFGSVFAMNLRAFVDLDQRKKLVEAVPFLKGARLALKVDNLFDSRQRVTDPSGAVPISYQADYMDPKGRMIGLDFRKTF